METAMSSIPHRWPLRMHRLDNQPFQWMEKPCFKLSTRPVSVVDLTSGYLDESSYFSAPSISSPLVDLLPQMLNLHP